MKPRRSRSTRGGPGVAVLLVLMSLVSTGRPGRADGPEPIAWRSEYAGAIEEARSADRPLWLQFTGPWCPNCARMEQDSFSDPDVKRHARRSFVPVKLRSDLNEELALGFQLTGLPATVIVAPSREVVLVHQGYLGPDDLDALLENALDRGRARREESRRITGLEPDPDLQTRTGQAPSANPDDSTSGTGQARAEGEERKVAHHDINEHQNQNPNQKRIQKTEDQLALSGYCPVSLVSEKKLVAGNERYTATHEGRLYRFASLVTFNLFRRDPRRYAPVDQGLCPVCQLDLGKRRNGDPRWGVLYEGRLFLCSTREERARFLAEPARYAVVDVAERGFCPHCKAEDGQLVRGDPRYKLEREGRRYWFPDPAHRQAFLLSAAAEATRR